MPVLDRPNLMVGVYRKVDVGFVVTEDGPRWVVDIASHIAGVTFTGSGRSLAEASEAAEKVLWAYGEGQADTFAVSGETHVWKLA